MNDAPQAPPLPVSTALAEASPESLSELFSRDPEGYSTQDLDRVILALREQRARWAATASAPKPPRSSKPAGANLVSKVSLEDLGL